MEGVGSTPCCWAAQRQAANRVAKSPTERRPGAKAGTWRFQAKKLRQSSLFFPNQRCSVGSSLRYQPTPGTREQRSAQDYTFEALHRVCFHDAWRVQPVLDAPESDLVLPRNQAF